MLEELEKLMKTEFAYTQIQENNIKIKITKIVQIHTIKQISKILVVYFQYMMVMEELVAVIFYVVNYQKKYATKYKPKMTYKLL